MEVEAPGLYLCSALSLHDAELSSWVGSLHGCLCTPIFEIRSVSGRGISMSVLFCFHLCFNPAEDPISPFGN